MQDFIYRGWLVLITESGHTDEILVGEEGRGGGSNFLDLCAECGKDQ